MDVLVRRLLLNVLPVVVVVSMLYFAIVGSNGVMARYRMQQDLAREKRHLEEVQAQDARLRREVSALQNDPLTLERAAAEDLQLVPEGSTVYRFP